MFLLCTSEQSKKKLKTRFIAVIAESTSVNIWNAVNFTEKYPILETNGKSFWCIFVIVVFHLFLIT